MTVPEAVPGAHFRPGKMFERTRDGREASGAAVLIDDRARLARALAILDATLAAGGAGASNCLPTCARAGPR